MSEKILPRRLWHADRHERVVVDQEFLRTDGRSHIVLGEAGMGKSTLLAGLRGIDGHAFCTARELLVASDPKSVLGGATTLLIDALDEVPARGEGDAVDKVLNRLDRLGRPRFILSCRVADWRSATALEGISASYPEPLELHLEPLDRNDAVAFLAASTGDAEAERMIDHLESRGLSGLWRNPQTLGLIREVGSFPESRGDLFSGATKLLRAEQSEKKAGSPLAEMPEENVLDAAGAGFAALILTGKEAISRKSHPDETDVKFSEVSALPDACRICDMLDSRLFKALAPERFTYAHRAIGEFLGVRWLARQADTERKRRRLLELFDSRAPVPASLRGIHAWLAWHSPALADRIITADPMGILEYGDADDLSPTQGRALLNALRDLSHEDPGFSGGSEYRAGGLVQPALLPAVREIIEDPSAEFDLRRLVLQVLEGSGLISELREPLLALLLDDTAVFALRSGAGRRLVELKTGTDWPDVVGQLVAQSGDDSSRDNSSRLAIWLMDMVGYDLFDDALVLDTVVARLNRAETTVGIFWGLQRNLPDDRIDALLDGVVTMAISSGDRQKLRHSNAITDLVFALLARRLACGPPEASKLWHWLQPFEGRQGFQRETWQAVARALRANDELRRAVQRHVLIELEGERNIRQRAWRLPPCLQPGEDDVLWLLDQLDPGDPRWRELVHLSRHGPEDGTRIRAAAERFIGNAEDRAWLEELADPPVPDWQIEQEQEERKREAEQEAELKRHRDHFTAHIEEMRAGDYGCMIDPARAYLKFVDVGGNCANGADRIGEWLGPDLRDAALAGFEAFLTAESPRPTADDIAASHAEGKRWDAALIIVAALAERSRTGIGFDDLADERLMAGFIELSQSQIGDHAGIGNLEVQLGNHLRDRGRWDAAQRLLIEPQLVAGLRHVTGLYDLMRGARDADLAETLGAGWLASFPDMSHEAETEILDRLLTTPTGRDAILDQLPGRLEMQIDDQRRLTWDSVGLLLDFEATRRRLSRAGQVDKDLLWEIRVRLGDRDRHEVPAISPDVSLLEWTISTFRSHFPFIPRPDMWWTGSTDPWDATSFLVALVNRLGNDTTPDATKALVTLRDAPEDGYTGHLRTVLAEQKRKRAKAEWEAPDLSDVTSAITDKAPTTAPQLQAVMLEELAQVQAKVRGSNVDWYRDFFKDSGDPRREPRCEDECRDTILKMFGDLPFGIEASPEGHLADDRRCDIGCTLSGMMVPIEVKGQWHRDLWTAADRQLDRLYTNDCRAGRGIYVVLWFGTDTSGNRKLRGPPPGIDHPKTADALRDELAAQSATTREGRTETVVLDLTRLA